MSEVKSMHGYILHAGDKVICADTTGGLVKAVITHFTSTSVILDVIYPDNYKKVIGKEYSQHKIYKLHGNN